MRDDPELLDRETEKRENYQQCKECWGYWGNMVAQYVRMRNKEMENASEPEYPRLCKECRGKYENTLGQNGEKGVYWHNGVKTDDLDCVWIYLGCEKQLKEDSMVLKTRLPGLSNGYRPPFSDKILMSPERQFAEIHSETPRMSLKKGGGLTRD